MNLLIWFIIFPVANTLSSVLSEYNRRDYTYQKSNIILMRAQSASNNIRVSHQGRPVLSAMAPKKLSMDVKEVVSPTQRPDSSARVQSGNPRSISSAKSIATELMDIQPKEVTFFDIQTAQRQEAYITIRNLSKQRKRIRFQQPKSQCFRVDYDMQQGIAAGLATKILVYFETFEPITTDYHDSVWVVGEGINEEICLHALKSAAKIIFDEYIDFGYVQSGKQVRKTVKFKNIGTQTGKISIKSDYQGQIKVEPHLFELRSHEQTQIEILFKPKDMGSFRGFLDVQVDGVAIESKIDISATCVDHNRLFLDQAKAQCSLIDFGELYMGKTKVFSGTYVNNTPKAYSFKVVTRQGLHTNQEEFINLFTPNELGMEQCEKVIHVQPSSGYIEPYSTVQLQITCCGPVSIKSQMQAKSFCFQPDKSSSIGMILDFQYSLIFELDSSVPDDPLIIHVQGKQVIPMVKVSRQVLNFGECDANENKDILVQVENLHPTLKVDVAFSKISCFFFKPEKFQLKAQTALPLVCTFTPKNVGKYNTAVEMILLDGLFKIPLKLQGESAKIAKKRPQTRGTEARPQDFEIDPKFIDIDHLDYQKRRKNEITEMNYGSKNAKAAAEQLVNGYFLDSQKTGTQFKQTDDLDRQAQMEENLERQREQAQNKSKYNNFLSDQRNGRLEKQRQQILQSRVDEIQKRMKDQGIQPQQFDATDPKQDRDPKLSAPVDYEFEFGLGDMVINEPDLPLPSAREPLFVVKPIDKYEPPKLHEDEKAIFKPDPLAPITKILSNTPTSHKQRSEITRSLSPEDLKKILAGPVKIDFGTIYVNSMMKRTFSVKNELRYAIQCRMLPDTQELRKTYSCAQIIESAQVALFQVGLQPLGLGQFKQTLKYVINEQYFFDILLVANVEAVNIELSKTQLKFQFNEDNQQFQTIETIKLTNNGSGPATYRWVIGENVRFFSIENKQGEVPAQSSIDVQITYKPSSIIKDPTDPAQDVLINSLKVKDALNRVDDEKLVLKVEDGMEQQLKCIGFVTDLKCQLKQTSLEMGEFAVYQVGKATFQVKNTSRTSAVFKVITTKLPSSCTITPAQGRFTSEELKEFTVKFESTYEQSIDQDIIIQFRSGRILRLPLKVQSVIPKVKIEQSIFDFGRVTTLGNQGSLPMSIRNESGVPAELVFDLRNEDQNQDMQEGVQCLQIIQVEDLDRSLLKSMQGDTEYVAQTLGNDDDEEEDHDNSKVMDQEGKTGKRFFLAMLPYQTLNFELKICPREIKKYTFVLPVELHKYGTITGLKRIVSCMGCQPKFMVEPQFLDFGRKILLTPIEKNTPLIKEILLSNPETSSISFRIDDGPLQKDRIFEVVPVMGRVDGGQTLRVKVIFNPKLTGEYDRSLSIYLDEPGQANPKPYLQIHLSGIAAKPRLLFDKREVILPPVPLNITSKAVFKVVNDGFENMKVSYKPMQDFVVSFVGPDGDLLGVSKQHILVCVSFTSPKPISITSILELVDQTQQTYSIALSATADNCVFTNFPYLISHENQYTIAVQNPTEQFKSPLYLNELPADLSMSEDTDEIIRKRGSSSRKNTHHVLQTQATNTDVGVTKEAIIAGHDVMSNNHLMHACDQLKRWLNFFVLVSPIDHFPSSIVLSNGEQLFELISFLTNKTSFPYKVSSGHSEIKQREERIKLLLNQYKEMIFQLKTEGALLNHIRPEHLLPYQDYSYYIRTLEANSVANQLTVPSMVRLSQNRFDRVQVMGYLVVVYQILKLYYLPRVTFKQLKSHCPNINVFDSYVSQSNVYGSAETLLMRWIENQYDIFHSLPAQGQLQPLRLTSLNNPLKDGHLLAMLCLSYIGAGAQKYFSPLGLTAKVTQKQDIHTNMSTLLKAFSDVGVQSHFSLDDFKQMGYPETLLLLMTLYNTLPNYIPRGAPIMFQCILGSQVVKTIELTNPTNKTVAYWVKIDGSSDFVLDEDDSIRIPPKQTVKYRVRFGARVSDEQQARISFVNKREGNTIVGALVFDLRGSATGRMSDKIWTISSVLYEPKDFSITVVNKFSVSEFGNFTIQLQPIKVPFPKLPHEQVESKPKKKQQTFMIQKEKTKKELEKEQKEKELLERQAKEEPFPAFFCKQDNIRLKRGASYNLQMQFIPLVFNQQKCYIIFQDPQVGEFQYELIGTVEPPDVMLDIKPTMQVFIDTPITYAHHVPLNNPYLRRARKLVEQVMIDRKKAAPSHMLSRGVSNIQSASTKMGIPGGLQTENLFYVVPDEDTIAAYVTTEKSIVIKNYKVQNKTNSKQGQNEPNVKTPQIAPDDQHLKSEEDEDVKLSFDEEDLNSPVDTNVAENPLNILLAFKTAVKDFIQYFTLINQERTDVRRIRVTVTAIPKPVRATIEMTCPARETLVQDIPICNATDRDFVIKVVIAGVPEKYCNCFSVVQQSQVTNQNTQQGTALQQVKRQNNTKDHIIKKRTNGAISLAFSPTWVCVAEAKLTLTNQLTNDLYEYDLRGFGEEPLSEAHFTLQCLARHTQSHIIPLTNNGDTPVTYTTFTDLINATGIPTFTVQPRQTIQYELSVTPMVSGQYTGQITFNDDATGTYRWFTITLETETPSSKASVSLVAAVGKAIAFDIELGNPLNEPITIEVIYTGDGLTGDTYLAILPGMSSVYQLIFAPKDVSTNKGTIAFLHPRLGEIWYELDLVGQEGQGVRLAKQAQEIKQPPANQSQQVNKPEIRKSKKISPPQKDKKQTKK